MTLREAIDARLVEVIPAYRAFYAAETATQVYEAAKVMAEAIWDMRQVMKEMPE